MKSFGPVAPFYDALMASVPYRMWVSYYLLLLARQDVHPKSILDVCCGTGSVAELLDEEGFKVTGFDLSDAMIERAREKAAAHGRAIRYEVADAATFDLGKTFDAAFSFFDSLNYVTDPTRLQMALHQVAKHVKPGGSFIFDLNAAYAFEAKLFDQSQHGSRTKVKYDWKGHWDPETRLIRVDMKFWFEGTEYEETHLQRAYSDAEICAMLDAAGFEQIEAFESYTLNPPRAKSDRIHYCAIRGPDR